MVSSGNLENRTADLTHSLLPDDLPAMSLIDQQSVFSAMLQDGPFAVEDAPPLAHPFSRETKDWVKKIQGSQLLKTKYRSVRNQIFDLLGIRDL